MKKETLEKARFLQSDIWQAEQDLRDIDKVLEDYDNFGSTVQFKRNKDGFSRSFGSKKFDFRKKMRELLEALRADTSVKLPELNKQMEEL